MKLVAGALCLCLIAFGSSAATIGDRLQMAKAGDTIMLEGGRYGTLTISNIAYADFVTLRSADPDDPAVFDRVEIRNSRYIAIEDIHVDGADDGVANSKLVDISDGSAFIRFTGSEVNGKVDASDDYRGFQGHYGIHAGGGVDDILIADNDVHDVKNGIVVLGANQVEIRDNRINRIGNDSMKFAALDGAIIAGNVGATEVFGAPDAHLDFIQFQGSSRAVQLIGNVYLAGSTPWVQGIFLDDGNYEDIIVEDNVIYTGMINGLVISAGTDIVVRHNTILNIPGEGHKATTINVPEGSIVENNIFSGTKGAVLGSNIQIQHQHPDRPFHYSQLYRNAERGRGLLIGELQPIAGSRAEHLGAARLLTDVER
ncbi:MAG: right-handed parallel beta-helix repeat-containing protein [Pseudomonadota bacterium]